MGSWGPRGSTSESTQRREEVRDINREKNSCEDGGYTSRAVGEPPIFTVVRVHSLKRMRQEAA